MVRQQLDESKWARQAAAQKPSGCHHEGKTNTWLCGPVFTSVPRCEGCFSLLWLKLWKSSRGTLALSFAPGQLTGGQRGVHRDALRRVREVKSSRRMDKDQSPQRCLFMGQPVVVCYVLVCVNAGNFFFCKFFAVTEFWDIDPRLHRI